MSEDLLKSRKDRLRRIIPGFNKRADEANAVVQDVEKFLTDELGLGLSVRTEPFTDEPLGSGDIEQRFIRRSLAYGRIADVFRIHIVEDEVADDVDACGDQFTKVFNSEVIPWKSCSRSEKLAAFEKLPELLDVIVAEAERLESASLSVVDNARDFTTK